jgi:hypothetical protein
VVDVQPGTTNKEENQKSATVGPLIAV